MSDYLKEPLIFVGFPRSGTTIISEILLQHHSLAWVSNYQQKFPDSTGINLVRNIFHNTFWKINGQKNQLNKVPFLNKYIFKPSESYKFWNQITEREFAKSFLFAKEECTAKVSKIRSFFKQLVKYQNRERLAFKITGPSRLMYLHSIFPDAYFVHIKRKPLPTIRSLLKVDFWNEGQDKRKLWWRGDGVFSDNEKKYIKNLRENKAAHLAALQYFKVNQLHLEEQRICNANVHKVAYEDFICRPKEIIDEVLKFANLKWDNSISDYFEENEIFNKNKKKKCFLSPELDSSILRISNQGIE